MSPSTESLVLEHLRAIRATQDKHSEDLREIIEVARKARGWIRGLASRTGYPHVVEQAAVAGIFAPNLLDNQDQADTAAALVTKLLNRQEAEEPPAGLIHVGLERHLVVIGLGRRRRRGHIV